MEIEKLEWTKTKSIEYHGTNVYDSTNGLFRVMRAKEWNTKTPGLEYLYVLLVWDEKNKTWVFSNEAESVKQMQMWAETLVRKAYTSDTVYEYCFRELRVVMDHYKVYGKRGKKADLEK